MGEIVIRKATKEDASEILELIKKVRKESIFLASHQDDPMPSLIEEETMLENSKKFKFWLVAILDNKIVGIINFSGNMKVKKRHRASIGISVLKEYWGRHCGSLLIEKMLECARQIPGLEKIELGVFSDNERAISLYKKFGFEVEGVIKKAYLIDGVYHDEIYMCLYI